MTPSALARNVDPSTGSAFRKHPGADGSEPSAPPIKESHPYPKTTARNDLRQILHNGHRTVRFRDSPQLVASVRAVSAQEPEPVL
jgi:hypothetical protein